MSEQHEQSNLLTSSNGRSGSAPPKSSLRSILYFSHFFAQWAERMWEFGIVMFLSSIAPRSLFLVSSYGLFQCAMIIFSGSRAGTYIDNTPRLVAFRTILLLQNGFVFLCSVCCYVLLTDESTGELLNGAQWEPPLWAENMLNNVPRDYVSLGLIAAIHVFGAFGAVFSRASTVAIEKDWVVVLSMGSSSWLKETNVMMRQIDLGCKVLAPVVAGFVISMGDIQDAAIVVGLANILAILVEWVCTKNIYDNVSELAAERAKKDVEMGSKETTSNDDGGIINTMRAFFSQSVWEAGVALSLLYLNVLSFGNIMIAYLNYRQMNTTVIGLTRGVGETIGLLGTAGPTPLSSKFSS